MANFIGMAFWPREKYLLLQDVMATIEDSEIFFVGGSDTEDLAAAMWADVLVAHGSSPGPSFLDYMTGLMQEKGPIPIIVMGEPGQWMKQVLRFRGLDIQYLSESCQFEDIRGSVRKKITALANGPRTSDFKPIVERRFRRPTRGFLSSGIILIQDLIKTLINKNWSGRVEILNEDSYELGIIYMQQGVLVHAETDSSQGEAACYDMLSWKRSNYQFAKEESLSVRTIHSSWKQILLDKKIQNSYESISELYACV
ncbi:MAG: DUF4388 domain-containing protein [Verrucomicrobiota bacterium]